MGMTRTKYIMGITPALKDGEKIWGDIISALIGKIA